MMLGRPRGEIMRIAVRNDRSLCHVQHARRHGQAALRAVLGENDGRARVFRETAHGGQKVLGADWVEL